MIRRKSFGIKRKVAAPKKKRRTESDLKRDWLIQSNYPLRYTGLRGVFWYWLSREIRQMEWEKWGGLCITCLGPIENWWDGQCGHIIASKGCGEFLRFNPINLTIQHYKCNNPRFCPNAGALNAIHYDERHGQGAWQRLYEMRKIEAKEPKTAEYRALIQALPSYKGALIAHQIGVPATLKEKI